MPRSFVLALLLVVAGGGAAAAGTWSDAAVPDLSVSLDGERLVADATALDGATPVDGVPFTLVVRSLSGDVVVDHEGVTPESVVVDGYSESGYDAAMTLPHNGESFEIAISATEVVNPVTTGGADGPAPVVVAEPAPVPVDAPVDEPAPVVVAPVAEPAPVPDDTSAPVPDDTSAPVPDDTSAPVVAAQAPTLAATGPSSGAVPAAGLLGLALLAVGTVLLRRTAG